MYAQLLGHGRFVQSVDWMAIQLTSFRNIFLNVSRLAIGPFADADKKRDLYCVNDSGSLGVLNATNSKFTTR